MRDVAPVNHTVHITPTKRHECGRHMFSSTQSRHKPNVICTSGRGKILADCLSSERAPVRPRRSRLVLGAGADGDYNCAPRMGHCHRRRAYCGRPEAPDHTGPRCRVSVDGEHQSTAFWGRWAPAGRHGARVSGMRQPPSTAHPANKTSAN